MPSTYISQPSYIEGPRWRPLKWMVEDLAQDLGLKIYPGEDETSGLRKRHYFTIEGNLETVNEFFDKLKSLSREMN